MKDPDKMSPRELRMDLIVAQQALIDIIEMESCLLSEAQLIAKTALEIIDND